MKRQDRWNAVVFSIGDALWGFQAGLVAVVTVLALLLQRYGASGTMIGSISAIETGLVTLPQILGNYLVPSLHSRKRRIILWHLFVMIPFLFAMSTINYFSSDLHPVVVRWGLLLCFGGHYLSMGMIFSVWMDWCARLFSQQIRGRILGIAWGLFSLAGAVGALLSGWCIDTYANANVYGWLYLAAGCMAIFAMLVYTLTDDPTHREPDRILRLEIAQLFSRFRSSLRGYRTGVDIVPVN